ncbi:ACN9-domain-containing [Pyrrhoderma noxium]|uniref:Succinate dehydrogenase assembly factor 3 n=1 Tax=Pyrrhoderma noxium TaxID=2282107 RepID=A0A286UAT9_9AGAM|nr:ACN9-domain-containing [Pyrrhoderma noxium]
MKPSFSRLAKSITDQPLDLHKASISLLPPIPLYRGILRAHRRLPYEMRAMGDDYVKAEFRRHQKINNPKHVIGFLSQWKMYLDAIPKNKDVASQWTGRKLDPTVFEKMSAEQIGQLSGSNGKGEGMSIR